MITSDHVLRGDRASSPTIAEPISSIPAWKEQPIQRCPACDGAGFYLLAVALGDPRFGKLFPCDCKETERKQQQLSQLTQLSNLQAFHDQTFANFNPDLPGVRKAYLRSRDYAQQPTGWLLLFGSSGVGKTHLAAAVANSVLAKGGDVLFSVVPDLLDHLRATFGPSSEINYDARFELVRSIGLLVLDDIGTESTTAWAREKLYQILNHRYNHQLPTILTSNRPLESLDQRIVSRMQQRAFAGEILRITANDYRRKSTS